MMNIYDKLNNCLALVQLSGGKDSIATLHMLLNHGIRCKAIHFTHRWGYKIPTNEAERICKDFGIDLEIQDITAELSDAFLNGFKGRPCRVCKGIMDRSTLEYAIKTGASYICTGDSKSDKTLFRRLKNVSSIEDLYINRYFNASFELPENIKILRPLAEMDNDDVMKYLADNDIKVQRVGDTGDKYSEYSREGCPLQFKDYGAEYTPELMDKLKLYNEKCSAYAAKHGFRASVHLPSRFIVTLPEGHSDEVRKNIGIDKPEAIDHGNVYSYTVFIAAGRLLCLQEDVSGDIMKRMCERLELEVIGIYYHYLLLRNGSLSYTITGQSDLTLNLILSVSIDFQAIRNIIIELFHTDNFRILEQNSKE